MFKEFKEFIMRGNVLDLAIAVIIGAAFGKIIDSFVADVIMPPIGMALGKVDFANLYFNLSGGEYPSLAEAKKAGAAVIAYGSFINTVINFLIIALVLFSVVKTANRMRKQEPAAPPALPEPTGEEKLLAEIRDLLKAKG
jgi:large conductance mechanosensitive channel